MDEEYGLMDVASDTVKGGSIGSMLGPWGTAIGAVAGAGVGIARAAANKRSQKKQGGLTDVQTENLELQNKELKEQMKRRKNIRNLMLGYT